MILENHTNQFSRIFDELAGYSERCDRVSSRVGIRDFQIKKYPNYFLWNGLLARPDLNQAGSPLHKIGEIISWKSLTLSLLNS
jgi:hypothetical protein